MNRPAWLARQKERLVGELAVGEALWWDVRYSARRLRKRPGFTAIVVCSLALAIGANTAVFSVLDSLLLKSLPVERPEEITLVRRTAQQGTFWDGRLDTRVPAWTNPLWEEIRKRQDLFQIAFAFSPTRFDLAQGGQTEFVEGLWVSGNYFEALGVPPLLGRTFTADDDRHGGGQDGAVAVIDYELWQRRFGGSADVLGATLRLDRIPFTVVGVMPRGFFGVDVGSRFDVAAPLATERLVRGQKSRLDHQRAGWIRVMARMKEGQTLAAAERALRVAQAQIREASLASGARPRDRERYLAEPFALQPAANGTSSLRQRYNRPLVIIMAIVGLVLLIACGNIANLLLAHAEMRRHELSVRQALGASRWHVGRQLLIESLLLSGAGALAGLVAAYWASKAFVQLLSTQQQAVFLDVGIDWRVLAFTAAIAAATALLFGLAPSIRASRAQPIQSISARGCGPASRRRSGPVNLLVAGQIAFSLVLVVGAALFAQTLASLTTKDLGFERDPVLLAHLNLQDSEVQAQQRLALYERLVSEVRSIPGIAEAGISRVTPVSGLVLDVPIEIDASAAIVGRSVAYINTLTPGWFATYGTPIVEGRDFDSRDRLNSVPVAIVNEAFARKFIQGRSPVGLRVRNPQASANEQADWMEIVGLASDATYTSVRDAPPPTLYMPMAQQPGVGPLMTLGVRTARGAPAFLARRVNVAIGEIDRNLSMTFVPLKRQVDAALVRERVMAMLSGFFGSVALLLAALGLYGVTSYAVNRRRAEIGIRMALGSGPGSIVRLVLRRVWAVVCLGLLAGLGASIWLAKLVAPLLYGLQPVDPVTFAFSAAVLAGVGLLAGWIPAHRAGRIDPVDVLQDY